MDEKKTSPSDGGNNVEKQLGVITEGDGFSIHCITIIGQIEGHYLLPDTQKTTKYEHILPLLIAVEENKSVDGLIVLLNTVGGDVEAGLAIAEMLAGMKKPNVSVVLGGGHSIGIPVAVSCKKSFIVPTATMTVHPVRTNGTVLGVPQSFSELMKMQSRVTDFILSHSRISAEDFNRLLMSTDELACDIGTVINGNEAVRYGLIDRVGSFSDALDELKKDISLSRAEKNK